MRYSASSVLALALPVALAQTFTDCDPTKKSCPDDLGLPSKHFISDFAAGNNASWSAAPYSTITYGRDGADFSIADGKQAPTIESDFAIFFGRVEVEMKASPGTGIVSSIVLESKDLDEIDWEFLGGDTEEVQTNFYGKGNTTTYDRGGFHPVDAPQEQFHTYTIDWTSERMEWSIDGTVVRTVPYNDSIALNGRNYPQTPMYIKLGSWCGGCSAKKGTVEWAGGKPTFGKDPFSMFVRSVKITNYNPGSRYIWTDRSGSWQSIKVAKDPSSKHPGSATVTASASGSADAAGGSTATTAPTSDHAVEGLTAYENRVPGSSSPTAGAPSFYASNTADAGAKTESTDEPVDGSSATGNPTASTQSNVASHVAGWNFGSLFTALVAILLL